MSLGTSTANRSVGQGRPMQVVLPYIPELSDKLKHAYQHCGIKVCFKPVNTLRQKLVKTTEPTEKSKKCEVVYGIKCADCNATYVGETK